MPTFTCELSGETITSEAVVTPSGHICRRSLLLQKLAENGGIDPFDTGKQRPLSEDDLIELRSTTTSGAAPPTTTTSNSLTAHLQQLQTEYDGVLLELLDTRQKLQETRQELAQALYQNDAAVRVVARLAVERDRARAALQEWNSGNDDQPPAAKKHKTSGSGSSSNAIPEADLEAMVKTWEELHPTRKAVQKAKKAVPLDKSWKVLPNMVASGKDIPQATTCEHAASATTTALALNSGGDGAILATGGSLLEYGDSKKKQQFPSLTCSCAGRCIDVTDGAVAVGLANGVVNVVSSGAATKKTPVLSCQVGTSAVVDVRLHPDGTHLVAATADGAVVLCRLGGSGVEVAATLRDDAVQAYAAGALHPDGLIYVAGEKEAGHLRLWDFKSQSLAVTLTAPPNSSSAGSVTAVAVSNNGYHIAAAYAPSHHVLVWDLRKQSVLATLNQDGDDHLDAVAAVQFDDAGKYLAYSGNNSQGSLNVSVSEVKKWSTKARFEAPELRASGGGLVWGKSWIAAAGVPKDGGGGAPRAVFFGVE